MNDCEWFFFWHRGCVGAEAMLVGAVVVLAGGRVVFLAGRARGKPTLH
jgi:hypothetical protein